MAITTKEALVTCAQICIRHKHGNHPSQENIRTMVAQLAQLPCFEGVTDQDTKEARNELIRRYSGAGY